MKAIRTKYHGPGNVRGSRISATDEDGNRVIIGYDSALNSDQNHRRAALTLCAKMGWTGTLAEGALSTGYVYVFVEPRSTFKITTDSPSGLGRFALAAEVQS
jgi:hypothetical protein